MDWLIYENGKLVNTIHASEAFVKTYCKTNGYTYELTPEPVEEAPPTEMEQLRADLDYIAIMTGVMLK